jgi:hypothetical protein
MTGAGRADVASGAGFGSGFGAWVAPSGVGGLITGGGTPVFLVCLAMTSRRARSRRRSSNQPRSAPTPRADRSRDPTVAVANMRPNENWVARITESIIAVSSTMIEPVRFRYSASASPSPGADGAAGVERLGGQIRAAEDEAEERAGAHEQHHAAEGLGVSGIRRLAPEVVPADDADRARQEIRAVAEELKRQLGEECADTADEIRRRMRHCRGEEPDRIGRLVGNEGDQPDEREREERDAQELADPAGNARSSQRQISISTGSTSGRRPDRFLKNRRSSTRSFSVIRP